MFPGKVHTLPDNPFSCSAISPNTVNAGLLTSSINSLALRHRMLTNTFPRYPKILCGKVQISLNNY